MSDNSSSGTSLQLAELPQRVAGGHLHPLLVVPPPRFGRPAAARTEHEPAADVSEPDYLALVLAALHRLT